MSSFCKSVLQCHPIHALLSDSGRVRKGNEDACATAHGEGVQAFVVCDGMGGAAAGEVASQLAASTFLAHLTSPLAGQPVPLRPRMRIEAAIQSANAAVYRSSSHSPHLSGMGTTLVGLLYLSPADAPAETDAPRQATEARLVVRHRASSPRLWLANIGDSRCYLYREGALKQLTSDHSFVEEQLRAGQITADEAATSPMRNLITRAIGSRSPVDADIHSYHPCSGDLYLLASDGLTREMMDEDIRKVLDTISLPATQTALDLACKQLVDSANFCGGHDNITVLLVAFP